MRLVPLLLHHDILMTVGLFVLLGTISGGVICSVNLRRLSGFDPHDCGLLDQ